MERLLRGNIGETNCQAFGKIRVPAMVLFLFVFFSFVTPNRSGAGVLDVGIFMLMFVLSCSAIRKCSLSKILVLLYASVLFSSLLGLFYGYSFPGRSLLTFGISVVFLAFVFSYKFNPKEINYLFEIYIATCVFGSLAIFYNVFAGIQSGYMRYSATFFGIDRDSLYMCAFQMGAFYLSLNKGIFEKKFKILHFLSCVLIFAGQIFTGDRTALVVGAFVVVYNIFLLLFSKKGRRKLFLYIALLTIISFVSWTIISRYLNSFVFERLFTIDSYLDNNSRFEMWEFCIRNVFLKYPFFGVGFNNTNEMLISNGLHYSHNIYLDILCDQGIVGIGIFAVYLFELIRKSKDKKGTIGFVIASFATLFFVNGYNTMTFWIPIMLTALYSKYSFKS